MAVNETALLYEIESDKARKLKLILVKNRIKIKVIEEADYHKKLGLLVGLDISDEEESVKEEQEVIGEMLVLYGIYGKRLDQLLQEFRKNKLSIPLKALVTEHNKEWNAYDLYKEIKQEHEMMHQKEENHYGN